VNSLKLAIRPSETPTALPPAVTSSRFTQAVEFYRRPLEFFESCRRIYGDHFSVRLPSFPSPVTFVSDPEAVKAIFAADGTDRLESGSIAAPMMEPVIGKHSMLILDGAKHQRHRALTMPYFARSQFAKFGDDIARLIDQQVEEWPTGVRFPIRPRMQSITLQVILRMIFGERAMLVIEPKLLRKFFGRSPSPLIFLQFLQKDLGPLSPWGRFLRLRSELYRDIAAEIERRIANPSDANGDILASLMNARDDSGQSLERREIIDEIFTLIAAGNDTTATALSWGIFHIFKHASVLSNLREEVAGEDQTASRIASLPYLDATVKEVLRIAPIFTFVLRRLTQPTRIADYDLPAGTLIAPSIYLIHRRADLWDEPERFKPERFQEDRHPSNHFLPFGGGIRHCIGAALATYEMKLVVARVVTQTELAIDPSYVPRARWIGNFLGPSNNVPVVCTKRTDASQTLAAR
jgi:cytochrome P450